MTASGSMLLAIDNCLRNELASPITQQNGEHISASFVWL